MTNTERMIYKELPLCKEPKCFEIWIQQIKLVGNHSHLVIS